MKWKEYNLKISKEILERIEGFLVNESVPYSVYEDENEDSVSLSIYHKSDDFMREEKVKSLLAVLDALKNASDSSLNINEFDENNMVGKWKDFFPPVEVGGFMIFADKEDFDNYSGAKKDVIFIPPGMAFGTGHHFTTSFCIRMIEKYGRGKKHFLDIGCGSGILSIAACKRGFEIIEGFDIDGACVEESKKNFLFNCGSAKADFFVEGINEFKPKRRYDMICVNLYDDLILKYSGCIKNCCFEDSVLIMSGIRIEKSKDVKNEFAEYVLLEEESGDKEWCGFVYKVSIKRE